MVKFKMVYKINVAERYLEGKDGFRAFTTKLRDHGITLEYIPEGQLYRQRGRQELLHRAQ